MTLPERRALPLTFMGLTLPYGGVMEGRQTSKSPRPIQWWRRENLARRRPFLAARGRIREAVRRCLVERGLTEVETPAIQVSPGMEPGLRAFEVTLEEPGGAALPRYLHTSPEFAMKKLLAGGAGPIFQLARTYRNGERSATHHPEFTMLEWYRPDADYRELIGDCEALLATAAEAAGRPALTWQGLECRPGPPEILGVAEAFGRHAGIDLAATLPGGVPDLAALAARAAAIGIRSAEGDDWDDVFFRIFLERIEPNLGHPRPTVLIDYPIHMAALARPRADAPGLAERFELYVAGLELANAFGELTDPEEQRRRFVRDQTEKRRRMDFAYPIDEDFLAALADMPPASGIALGFDRLVMLASGAAAIEDVLWAPVEGSDEGP
ncbi:MAG: EF-P lysine aminoacylase GenX [Alphaproteobacteria bacterium]|nr:EF-P lysine aminoacylase GenX [Alphaproteobacteria bacterium]